MAHSFAPQGFDDDRKQRAERCESQWETATGLLFFLGVSAGAIGIPIAGGLLVAAALGPVLKHPFTRIKRDPPRDDFFLPTTPTPPRVDPTLAFLADADPDEHQEIARTTVALSVAIERTASYLDAMVTAAEKTLGAYQSRSEAAIDLNLTQVRHYGDRALHSSWMLAAATQNFGHLRLPSDWYDFSEETTLADLLPQRAPGTAERYLATGADEEMLRAPITWMYPHSPLDPPLLTQAADDTWEFARDVAAGLPQTVDDFIAEGEDAERWVPR